MAQTSIFSSTARSSIWSTIKPTTLSGDDVGEYEQWRFRLTETTNSMLQQLPQYLFRVASRDSQGTNLQGLYQSRSFRLHLGFANFYAYSKDAIRETLKSHVRNKHRPGHWISFTASINTAIEFALRMKEKTQKEIRIHIIDTTQLEKPALIVHSHSMLMAYDVDLDPNLSYDIARTRTSWNEFLVWDELQVNAGVVDFDDVLYPKLPRPNAYSPGLLELMPDLEGTPEKGTWSRANISRRFSLYYGLQAKLDLYNDVTKSVLAQKNPTWRTGRPNPLAIKLPEDNRIPLDYWQVLDYFVLVRKMAKSFQLPMVIALLSMRTNFINQDSMIEALIELPRKHLEVDGSKNRSFWRSTLRPDARVDVQVFEELYSEFCKYMVGEGSVTEGPQHDHRGILRLDADPKVADTTKARGSGPATMAMAYKTQWIGARQGRPDKLKAKLHLQRELEGEIDENEDFNETEAQLVNDWAPRLSAFELYTLHELVNATCRRRQNAARRDFVKKHGRRVPNQKLWPAYASDRVRKTPYAKSSHRALSIRARA